MKKLKLFRKKLASNYEDTDEYTGKIRSALSEVSDISDVGMPDSNGVFDIHEQMDSDLIKLVSNVNSYERENVVRLENSVELLLENLQSCLSKIGLSQGAIESYETGSFITGKDAGALNTGIKIFGDLHEKNKEAYDEIYETEQKIKDEAEKRKTQGIWRTVGGAVLIATGAACIVLTGGAAIPIVADAAVAAGSGTAVFGAADAIEGTQDIYYGSTGDIDSTAVNGIKDDLFQGNEDAYYLTENAFAFAASAMIPIGQASTAGMVAGMVASGMTAKGLNGIEAEANKLAKAQKGIDGVTEGAGNLAEDVGKAGKGLEGAAKGAESAAEDAGKVVESGSKTINGLNIIDGKVDGKIPLAEYKKYRVDSVHNIDSDTMTLGKYEPTIRADGTKDFSIPGPGAYTVKAGDTTYFSLGTEWDKITDTYGLDVAGQNMFDYFNKPALDDAINAGKEIRFSHNPEAYGECALKWEWDYLQEKHGYFALEKKGDFWYATK